MGERAGKSWRKPWQMWCFAIDMLNFTIQFFDRHETQTFDCFSECVVLALHLGRVTTPLERGKIMKMKRVI